MPPLAVDPSALDSAGSTLIDVGKDIGLTMSTLDGALSACGSMCGNDPVGAAMGQAYDQSAAAVVHAMAAARNGLVNLGDGVRVSAHNYSMADAQSDISGSPTVMVGTVSMTSRMTSQHTVSHLTIIGLTTATRARMKSIQEFVI